MEHTQQFKCPSLLRKVKLKSFCKLPFCRGGSCRLLLLICAVKTVVRNEVEDG